MGIPARGADHVAAERNLADIEFPEFESAVEGLLGLQRDRRDVAAFDLCTAVENCARAVVVADGQAHLKCHVVHPRPVAAATVGLERRSGNIVDQAGAASYVSIFVTWHICPVKTRKTCSSSKSRRTAKALAATRIFLRSRTREAVRPCPFAFRSGAPWG